MVYLLQMVIFHGELLNNQMVKPHQPEDACNVFLSKFSEKPLQIIVASLVTDPWNHGLDRESSPNG